MSEHCCSHWPDCLHDANPLRVLGPDETCPECGAWGYRNDIGHEGGCTWEGGGPVLVPACDPCRVRAAILMPTPANRTLGLDALDRLEGALSHPHQCRAFYAEQGEPIQCCAAEADHLGLHHSVLPYREWA